MLQGQLSTQYVKREREEKHREYVVARARECDRESFARHLGFPSIFAYLNGSIVARLESCRSRRAENKGLCAEGDAIGLTTCPFRQRQGNPMASRYMDEECDEKPQGE